MLRIDLYNETAFSVEINWLNRLEIIISKTMNINVQMVVSLALVGNEKMRELNNRYSGIDAPTDVLSFPESDVEDEYEGFFPEGSKKDFLGEIVIAVDVMREQATRYKVSDESEFARLFIHGCLHLMGYDHQNHEDSGIMRVKEDFMISQW